MTVLLVDIGNTRIKWARCRNGCVGRQYAAAHRQWDVRDYAVRVIGAARGLQRVVVASVADARTNRKLAAAARTAGGVAAEFVVSRRHAGGVTIGYLEPWRLGVDRFVAAIGAHRVFPRTSVLVIGIGTAMTIDLLAGDGRHLGGAIIPGPRLMVDALRSSTNGIRRRSRGGATGARGLFGQSTRAAIVQGARFAAAAAIDRAVAEARRIVKGTPLVVLMGGDARDVRPLIRSRAVVLPDLVLRGLAVLAQEGT